MTASPSSSHPGGRSPDQPGMEAPAPLSQTRAGARRVVTSVEGPLRTELEREGLLPGRVVVLAARVPLGGPVVIELGRTRLALSADAARAVFTVAAAAAGGDQR